MRVKGFLFEVAGAVINSSSLSVKPALGILAGTGLSIAIAAGIMFFVEATFYGN